MKQTTLEQLLWGENKIENNRIASTINVMMTTLHAQRRTKLQRSRSRGNKQHQEKQTTIELWLGLLADGDDDDEEGCFD